MTNSNQDDNESQTRPEVEDPITNPGNQTPPTQTIAEDSRSTEKSTSNSNSKDKAMLIVGVIGVLVVLLLIMSGGTEEDGAQNAGQTTSNEQTQGDAIAEAETQAGGEGGEFNEGGEGMPIVQDQTAPTNSEGAVDEDRVLDSIDLQTDITVSSNEELLEEVTDILVLSDRLGPNDVLSIDSEGEINGNRIIRMQQTHLGIPVFGAEVVAVESDGSVFNISGSTGNDIEISIDPALSFDEALALANQNIDISVSPREAVEDSQLLIIDVEGTYYLAWYVIALIGGSEERVFLDAQDGMILLRLPVNIGEA